MNLDWTVAFECVMIMNIYIRLSATTDYLCNRINLMPLYLILQQCKMTYKSMVMQILA